VRERTGGGLAAGQIIRGTFSEAGGYEATRHFLHRLRHDGAPFPTALFTTTDRMAVGVLHALKEAGLRIPEDVAVVGYDNDPAARFTDPPLTTVDAATGRSTTEATAMLLDLIHGYAASPQTKLLEAELVVRASCGASSRGEGVPRERQGYRPQNANERSVRGGGHER
jgi:LacI family transcriptional regulator